MNKLGIDQKLPDIEAFRAGTLRDGWKTFGAHPALENGVSGTRFTVWAPGVRGVSVTGSFCAWETDRYPLSHRAGGVWQTFVAGAKPGDLYKYYITPAEGEPFYKADPYAFAAELPPGTASRIYPADGHSWQDGLWLARRRRLGHLDRPLNLYEVHAGSWKRREDGGFLNWDELSEDLIPYAVQMGYTHLELMPVMEHPFDGSWGYQITGYYAPTARYGAPDGLKRFIDRCHGAGLGVVLDWVPGHFCRDAHGLSFFNGERLYEEVDHPQWGTRKFDFGRGEVRSFLLSNALYWIETFHADGLRIDGVTSMLYLNFGIDDPGQKRYNEEGSETDLRAVRFLQELNMTVGRLHPDVMMIAEESTAWPLVTYPPEDGGLGFHYKWDMGWMHDTLDYMRADFPYRPGCHGLLTFSIMYAFSENFILALSHDEVVHGKQSLIERMPGDYWRKFAGMRALMLYQMTHPGAKLNFMGSEFAQFIEWRFYEGLEWFLLRYEKHRRFQTFIRDLNALYRREKALWQLAYSQEGYEWVEPDDNEQAVILYCRHGRRPADTLTVLLRFVPEVEDEFRIGVAAPGEYEEIFNSDDEAYGGSGRTNPGILRAEKVPFHGRPYSVVVRTPPIGGLILKKRPGRRKAGRSERKD